MTTTTFRFCGQSTINKQRKQRLKLQILNASQLGQITKLRTILHPPCALRVKFPTPELNTQKPHNRAINTTPQHNSLLYIRYLRSPHLLGNPVNYASLKTLQTTATWNHFYLATLRRTISALNTYEPQLLPSSQIFVPTISNNKSWYKTSKLYTELNCCYRTLLLCLPSFLLLILRRFLA